jgi:hypothetical protein
MRFHDFDLRPRATLLAFLPVLALRFRFFAWTFFFTVFFFVTGLLTGAAGTFPAPENVRLDGVASFGADGGVEHASPSHSVGRGGGGAKPPSTRTA